MQVLRLSRYAPVPARQRSARFHKLAGLLTAVTVATASWMLILMLASCAVGIQTGAFLLVGFGLVIAALSSVGAAVVMVDC